MSTVRPLPTAPMSNEAIVATLLLATHYQVKYTHERRLKQAVLMRRAARVMGKEILRRVEKGTWND